MGSFSEEEEDQFFDTREDTTSMSDSCSDCPEILDNDNGALDKCTRNVGYEVWIKNPGAIHERRDNFLKLMGLSIDQLVKCDSVDSYHSEIEVGTDRIMDNSGAVLESSAYDDGSSSSHSSTSCWSSDTQELLEKALAEKFLCRIKNLDDGTEFIVDELGQDGVLRRLREVGSNRLLSIDEFERGLGLSPLVQRVMRRNIREMSNLGVSKNNVKSSWLRRLGSVACVVNSQVPAPNTRLGESCPNVKAKKQLVRVRSHKKNIKELSALYMGQDMQAHVGSILTMKFSPDGHYLASAGEDSIVRVWQIVVSERSYQIDFDIDHSRLYFKVNNHSELVPLYMAKQKNGKLKSFSKTLDSNCIVLPRKVFRILDKPIHEFHGHSGEVLDLSWSKNKYILSSSVDKTVRLWQVGHDQCLNIFSHNNYVTCVQFNPVNDNYFISGSIDGKVRTWKILGCQVVDWIDITEIVTAVCFRPDGQGAVAGSITGNCYFIDASDNCLQLCAQVCLQGKKKSPLKRITGFQFSPADPNILMVTSADSQVRVFRGLAMICKFQGIQSSSSQICASFTSDGKRVVSASEDSNVYVWNYVSESGPVSKAKNVKSCEHFFSNNASVAVPWRGLSCDDSNTSGESPSPTHSFRMLKCSKERDFLRPELGESSHHRSPFSSPEYFSMRHGFFSESLSRGSATWPAEKLSPPSPSVVSPTKCKSHYNKYLKMHFQSTLSSSHVWGLVIVTAGFDGRIRSYQNFGLPFRS